MNQVLESIHLVSSFHRILRVMRFSSTLMEPLLTSLFSSSSIATLSLFSAYPCDAIANYRIRLELHWNKNPYRRFLSGRSSKKRTNSAQWVTSRAVYVDERADWRTSRDSTLRWMENRGRQGPTQGCQIPFVSLYSICTETSPSDICQGTRLVKLCGCLHPRATRGKRRRGVGMD